MNWEAIAAIGQMLGSLAVFVSLWHLAAQIRESSKLTRYQIDLERYRTLWAPDASDSMIETWAKASRAGGGPPFRNALTEWQERLGLSDEEAIRLYRRHGHVFRVLESEFDAFGPRQELKRSIEIVMRAPDITVSWDQLRANSSPEFRAFVESTRGAQEA